MAEPDVQRPIPRQEVLGDRNGPLAWIEFALVRSLLVGTAMLPAFARRGLVGAIASLGTRFDRRHSDAARRFLAQAFGPELSEARREQLVRAAWRSLCSNALSDVLFPKHVLASPDPLSHYQLDVCDDMYKLRDAGQGGLIVTGHMGAWEALAALAPLLGFEPLYVVSRPPRNAPLSAYIQRTREERNVHLIHRRGAVRSVTKVLAAGGYVAMLVDQRARGRTVVAPFFGRPAHCERSVSVIVKRSRVPVMVAACFESERPFHYDVRVPRVFWPDELEAMTPEQMMTAINGELERMILSRPEQYFWLHDRYRKAPAAPTETNP